MLRASALLGQGLQAVWSSLWSLGHSFSGVDSSDFNIFLLSAKVSKEENEQTLFMYHSTMHPILPIYCVTSLYWSPLPFLQEYPLPPVGPFLLYPSIVLSVVLCASVLLCVSYFPSFSPTNSQCFLWGSNLKESSKGTAIYNTDIAKQKTSTPFWLYFCAWLEIRWLIGRIQIKPSNLLLIGIT